MFPRLINVGPASVLLLLALTTTSCGDGTAPAPQPTKLVFVLEPPTDAETMVPLTIQPAVQTIDANGQPAGSGATVTVNAISPVGAVASGGTATTNSSGVATFSGLTLGAVNGAVGSVTLEFKAPGLQSVTATINLHCALLPLTTGQTVSRAVTAGDCRFTNGSAHNMFSLMTQDPVTAVRLTEDGASRGLVILKGANEPAYFWGYGPGSASVSNRISFKALLPPGRTFVAVTSDQGLLGSYTLTTEPTSTDIACDGPAAVVASPVTTTQQLIPGDCSENSFLEDVIHIGLPTNATATVTMSSSAFDPQIKLLNALTLGVVSSSTAQGSTSITFKNTDVPTPYYVLLTTSVANASGAYNFSVNISYPASSSSAARALVSVPSAEARVQPTRRGTAPPLAASLLPAWAKGFSPSH